MNWNFIGFTKKLVFYAVLAIFQPCNDGDGMQGTCIGGRTKP